MTPLEFLDWIREAYARDCITLACFEDTAELILSGRAGDIPPHPPWPKEATA